MAPERAAKGFERLLRALAYCAGAVLIGMVGLVVYEVVMRYVVGRPVFGGFEITELAMVLIVSFGLPYCAITGGHVSVDVFSRFLDRPSLRWLNALVHLAGAALLAVVAWRATLYAVGSYQWGDLSNMLQIPKYPFQLAIAGSAALFALVLVLQAIRAARGTTDPGAS
ncbi:MAG TPA: TRAP transporter small permease [Candidatus Binatia bacterium]|nr:TRAP transporter small permease [Candidatus Binatia bacterium]